MFTPLRLAVLLVGTSVAPLVLAEATLPTLSLDQLLEVQVQAASKRLQKPTEAPSMVSIITAEEIRRYGWRSLAEALNSLPGIHFSYDRSYASVGLRGFGRPGDYNNRLLMLIDGMPFNDGVYDQASVGTDFPLDMAVIERIEYVPGPGSSLYGGNAFFGVVNIITQNGARHGNTLEAGAGSAGIRVLRAGYGTRDDSGNDWLLSYSRSRQAGRDLYFDSYAAPGTNAWSHNLDYDDNDRLFARYSKGGLLLRMIANQRNKGAPGGPYGADLNDPRNSNIESSLLLNLAYEHQIDASRSLNVSAYLLGYDYEGRWAYSGSLFSDKLENRTWGGEVRYHTRPAAEHSVVAGLSWRNDFKRHQFNDGLDTDKPRHSIGIFAQDDWEIDETLTLSLGIRHDRIETDTSHSRLSPRAALIIRPVYGTTIKILSGTAFRPPNGFETDYAFPGTNRANPFLKPEFVRTQEIGVQQQLSPRAEFSASIYRNQIRNLIALEVDSASGMQQHHNVGRVVARGIEVAARADWEMLRLRGSLAWQSVTHESGTELANTPRRLAKLLATLPLSGATSLSGELQYLGPRTTDSGDISTEGRRIGGHTLAHLALGGMAGRDITWQLRINNVFNRRHVAVVGTEFSANFPAVQVAPMPIMEQDGRMLFGSVKWAF